MTGGASIGAIKTDPESEAKILNQIRAHQKKFEPKYLKALQQALGVSNASGAFNTETLRALRAHYRGTRTQVSYAAIMQGNLLTSIHPGTPFRDTTSGFGSAERGSKGEMDDKTELRADALAQALGYDSYAGLLGAFQPVVLLGKTLGEGLPHLATKVGMASEFLRQHFTKDGKTPTDKEISTMIGWNRTGAGAYGHNVESIGKSDKPSNGPHLHAAGLAIDIDGTHNPFVFPGLRGDGTVSEHLHYAAQLYGGKAVSAAELMKWSREMSTEELWAHVDKVSDSLRRYLELAKTGTDEAIVAEFRKAGYTDEQARPLVAKVRTFGETGGTWHGGMSRDDASELTNHSKELVVALRDVAGLAWGGTEMSEGVSGDFMHFDCRNESVGQTVTAFSLNNKKNTDAANKAAVKKAQADEASKTPAESP